MNQKNYQELVAEILIKIESVKFSFNKPFTLTSGEKSPVYVDCRKIISFIKERNTSLRSTKPRNVFTGIVVRNAIGIIKVKIVLKKGGKALTG